MNQINRAELAQRAGRAAAHIAQAHEQARALAHGFAPLGIEPNRIAEALSVLASDTNDDTRVDISFEADPGVVAPSPEAARHLYRIAQEALTNALCHSECERVMLTLRRDRSDLVLAVEDDGCGLPDNPSRGTNGLGFRTMVYRARRSGGNLIARRRPEGGTIITVRLPDPSPSGEAHSTGM